jgi:hypothetical protein
MVTALSWSQERMNPTPGPNQDLRIVAVLRCANNDKHLMKIPIGAFGGNPQAIAKLFERAGWQVDQHNKAKCLCPSCLKAKKGPKPPVAPVVRVPEPAQVVAKAIEAGDIKMPVVDIKTIPSTIKVSLRNLLDKFFDDAAGAYIEGYSDEKIAEEVDVPRATVFAYREAAYGPLKRDPDVDAVLAGLADIRAKQADIQSQLAKLEIKAQACLKKLGL